MNVPLWVNLCQVESKLTLLVNSLHHSSLGRNSEYSSHKRFDRSQQLNTLNLGCISMEALFQLFRYCTVKGFLCCKVCLQCYLINNLLVEMK